MARISGKDLSFIWDSVERPIISADLSDAFDTIDGTDTGTPSPYKDYVLARASKTFTIETFLYNGNNKITGNEMGLIIDGVPYPTTDIALNLVYDELEVTDTLTDDYVKEIEVGRIDAELTASLIIRDDLPDLFYTNPPTQINSLKFDLGLINNYDGIALPISKNIVDNVNEFAKIDYTFKYIDTLVDDINIGLNSGELKSFKIILKSGLTNKEYLGSAIITSKQITANINDAIKISYTFTINGSMTENEYSSI